MRGTELLLVAEALGRLAEGQTEPFARSIVNRIYFAAHHNSIEHLRSVGLDPVSRSGGRRDSRHWRVVEALIQDRPDAGDALNQLRLARTNADYDVDEEWRPEAVEDAWRYFRELRRLLGTT